MSKAFQCVICDPPWDFSDPLKMSDTKRGASSNYNTMTLEDIKNLPIQKIADPKGCVLCLWVPSSLLQEGLDVMKCWGFNFKQTYIWVKTKKDPFKIRIKNMLSNIENNILSNYSLKEWKAFLNNNLHNATKDILSMYLGRFFRQTHEICLIGINNTGIYKKLKNKSQRSVCLEENLKHSAKPDDLQNSLELMLPGCDFLECFARRQKQGWICLGNEIDGLDIRDALKQLID